MTAYRGQLRVGNGAPVAAAIEPNDSGVALSPEGGSPTELAYVDIEDLHDADYVLRLTDHTGQTYELTMLGRAYGQVLEDVRKAREARLEKDLLLRGVGLQDTIPGKLFGGEQPVPVRLRLYEDLLVAIPERGTMFGIPYAFVEEVVWDEELYQVRVRTDLGEEHVFGHLGRRSEELRDELRRLIAALERRTAATLRALLPGSEPGLVTRLASMMRDGRVVQRRRVDALAPQLWGALEDAVAGTPELRAAYDDLSSVAGWTAFGIKAVRPAAADGPADAPDPEPTGSGARADLWYLCPLAREGRPLNAAAQEVTSEPGHATYVFRLMEPARFASLSGEALADEVERSLALLNRALLQLNFRREPIYLSDEQIAADERYARYRVALRKLPHLRRARASFLGRAAHDAGWRRRIDELAASA